MSGPRPGFVVQGATAVEFAAAPTLCFTLGVSESEGLAIYTIALTCQIHIDPARRTYDAETRERLVELFGEPRRWAATTHSFRWLQTTVLVPSFQGSTTVEVPVPCSYDLEIAATKYIYSLPDGEVPLTFHFSGTILYQGEEGTLRLVQVPWDGHAQFRLPVEVWRRLMTHYYPNTGWITLHSDTLSRLSRYKARQGLPTFDACVSGLLQGAEESVSAP